MLALLPVPVLPAVTADWFNFAFAAPIEVPGFLAAAALVPPGDEIPSILDDEAEDPRGPPPPPPPPLVIGRPDALEDVPTAEAAVMAGEDTPTPLFNAAAAALPVGGVVLAPMIPMPGGLLKPPADARRLELEPRRGGVPLLTP